MWTKFKWDMFVTSFIPLWISIIIFDIWDLVDHALSAYRKEEKPLEILLSFVRVSLIQIVSILVIIIVAAFSIHGINKFLRDREKSRQNPTGTILSAKKANMLSSEFLLAYILPLIAFDFSKMKSIVLFLIYFAILAFLCIRNSNIYTNIMLEYKKYRIYSCDIQRQAPGNQDIIYYDSLVISQEDLSSYLNKSVKYWDCDNYIYIHIKENTDNE